MYVGKILLTHHKPVDKDVASDVINFLLGALRMNGQVCGREFPIAITPRGYAATCMLPEKTSLNANHHNRWVRECLQKIQEAGLEEPDCGVAEELDGAGACDCEHPESYLLYTTHITLESPLRCGECFLPVPLYRIPPMRNEEYNDVISWQSYYQACDTLQMNCTPMERSAMRQLSRLDSGLSEHGLALCRQIKELTRIPTYYYLYRYGARSRRQEQKRLCPSCEREWLLPTPWHIFDFRCDHCHLASNLAWSAQ